MLTRMLLAACLLPALTACAADEPPPLVPPSLLVGCPAPVDLPSRGLTGAEVEIMWGRDRSALRSCASRHAALADFVKESHNAPEND